MYDLLNKSYFYNVYVRAAKYFNYKKTKNDDRRKVY